MEEMDQEELEKVNQEHFIRTRNGLIGCFAFMVLCGIAAIIACLVIFFS